MKSVKHPPYQLRTNKAVDRLLLVDLLRELEIDERRTTYYSFGGPFLEDLRIMSHFFPQMRLVSLEIDAETCKRQIFHKFNSKIEIVKNSLDEFLLYDYQPSERDVFWLDYTGLKYGFFTEFQRVLLTLPINSVVRITLRAEKEFGLNDALVERLPPDIISTIRKESEEAFEKEFGALLPPNHGGVFAAASKFAIDIQQMIRIAASKALDQTGQERDFLPLQATRYKDGVQMLSVTGLICQADEKEKIQARLKAKSMLDLEWNEPRSIDVPILSNKECLKLEEFLPVEDGKEPGAFLLDLLKYEVGGETSASKKQLAQYADYYRQYPNFVRIVI